MNSKRKKKPFYYGLAGLLSCSLLMQGTNTPKPSKPLEITTENDLSPFFANAPSTSSKSSEGNLENVYDNYFTEGRITQAVLSTYSASAYNWTSGSNVITYAGYTFTQTTSDGTAVPFTTYTGSSNSYHSQTNEVYGNTSGLTVTPTNSNCIITVTMATGWFQDPTIVQELTMGETETYVKGVSYPFTTTKNNNGSNSEYGYSTVQLYFKGDTSEFTANPARYVIEDLSIYRNGGGIATRGNVEIGLSGDNFLVGDAYGVTAIGDVTLYNNNSGENNDAKDTQGYLEIYTKEGSAIRLGSDESHLEMNGGSIFAQGEYAIGEKSRMASAEFNGGYFHGVGYNYGVRFSASSASVGDENDFGTVTINGGELFLETTHAVSGAHAIEAKIETGTAEDGKNAGVLIVNSNMLYPSSVKPEEDWNLLYVDTRTATDPFHTYWPDSSMPIYDWNDSTNGGEEFDRQYGRIYGNVALKQPFTMEETWILDIPVGTSFRHTTNSDAGTGTSYLTMEGDLTNAQISDKQLTAGNVYSYKYAVLRFMGEYVDEDGNKITTAPPFLWNNSHTAPQGSGQIQLILSPSLLGGGSSTNDSNVAYLKDGKMEYNNTGIGQADLAENGFTGTLWAPNYNSVSIKYLLEDGSGNGIGVTTPLDAGIYQNYISIKNYSTAMYEESDIHVHTIGTASKLFEITPFDIGVLGDDDKTYKKTMSVSVEYNDSSKTTNTYSSDVTSPSGDLTVTASESFIASNALALDIMGNLTTESMAKITVRSNLDTMTYGTDYYITTEQYEDVVGADDLGTMDITVVGMGNYQGQLGETITVSVYTNVLASLGDNKVAVQALDEVYQKPDGTIDISGMDLELVVAGGDNKTLALDDDYTIEYGDVNGLNYEVTIRSKSDGQLGDGSFLTFTVQAKAAGTGDSFEDGLIYLVEPFYQRPDGLIYPEDLILYGDIGTAGNTSSDKRQLVLGEDYFLSTSLEVNGNTATFFATGALTEDDDIAFDTTVFNREGADLEVTAYFMTDKKGEDYSSDDFEATIKALDQVTFAIEYIEAGDNMISTDLGSGTLEVYTSKDKIYIAEIYYSTVGVKYFPLDISGLELVATVPDGTSEAGETIDHTLTASDISYVTTYDLNVDTDKYSSIRKSTYFEDGLDDTTLFGKDTWYLTVVGTGDFRGSTTFTVPDSQVEIVKVDADVAESIKGTFDGHYILAIDEANLYVKPDGTLHNEDIVIEYISTEVDKNSDPVSLKTKTLPTSSYNLTIGTRGEEQTIGEGEKYYNYPLTLTNSAGASFTPVTGGKNLSVNAKSAGTGDHFRYGYLEEVSNVDLNDVLTYTEEDGTSHAPENGKGFDEDDVKDWLHHVKTHWEGLNQTSDYTLSFNPSFYGSDLYTVTATDNRSGALGLDLGTGVNHKVITFDLQITVPYVVTYHTNYPDDSDKKNNNDDKYLDNEYLQNLTDTIQLPKEEPEAPTNYKFLGWFTQEIVVVDESKATQETAGKVTTGDQYQTHADMSGSSGYGEDYYQVLEVFAMWEEVTTEITYTVDFDLNDTTQDKILTSYTNTDDTVTVTLPTEPTRDGYTFGGWHTKDGSDDYGDKVDENTTLSSLTLTEDNDFKTTVYAKWDLNDYTLTFDVDGSETTETFTIESTEDDVKAFFTPEPTKANHKFLGWSETDSSSDILTLENLTGADLFEKLASNKTEITLTAQWVEEYTITFDNDGTTTELKVVEDQTGITFATPTKSGYTFLGWATSVWTDSSQDPQEAITYYKGDVSWSDISSLFSDDVYAVTLYAHWEKDAEIKSYEVTFAYNNGSEPDTTDSSDVADGSENIDYKDPTTNKTNHQFAGWYFDSGLTNKVDTSDVVTFANLVDEAKKYATDGATDGDTGEYTITLYANWVEEYSITYDVNYPTDDAENAPTTSPSSVTVTSDKNETVTLASLDDTTTYKFLGWATKIDATTATFGSGVQGVSDLVKDLNAGDRLKLYGVWEKITGDGGDGGTSPDVTTYTVSFDWNYTGSTNPADYSTTEDTVTITFPTPVPTRENYSFKQWNTKGDGTGTKVDGNTILSSLITTEFKVTLYAIWEPTSSPEVGESYKLTYDVNYPTSDIANAPTTPNNQEDITGNVTLPNLQDTDLFIFKGWGVTGTNDTTLFTGGTQYQIARIIEQFSLQNGDDTMRLVANWEAVPETYTVNYNWGFGTSDVYEVMTSVVSTATANFPSINPSRDGYLFLGWSRTENGTTILEEALSYDTLIDMANNKTSATLYGVWQEVITFGVEFYLTADSDTTLSVQPLTTGLEKIKYPNATNPERDGYIFTGWALADGTEIISGTTTFDSVVSDITVSSVLKVYAQWEQAFLVNYHSNYDGSILEKATLQLGDTISYITPTRPDYVFAGWYTSPECTDNTLMQYGTKVDDMVLVYNPLTGLNLYAKWQAIVPEVSPELPETEEEEENNDNNNNDNNDDNNNDNNNDNNDNNNNDNNNDNNNNNNNNNNNDDDDDDDDDDNNSGGSNSGGSSSSGSGSSSSGSGSSSSGSGSSSSGSSSSSGTVSGDSVNNRVEATLNPSWSNGDCNVTVDSDMMDEIVSSAPDSAFDIVITPSFSGNLSNLDVGLTLDREAMEAMINSSANSLTLFTDHLMVTFDRTAVEHILNYTLSQVTISADILSSLSAEAQVAFGSRPLFSLDVTTDNGTSVSSLGGGNATVTIPYTVKTENPNNILAGRITANGNIVYVAKSVYDTEKELLRFSTQTMGNFGVATREYTTSFSNQESHWSTDYLNFTDLRDLYETTSLLDAGEHITREMFVTMLGKLHQVDETKMSNVYFHDVDSSSPHAPYIQWAFENDIVAGPGEGYFIPDETISRQDMALILMQYVSVMGVDMDTLVENSAFADSGDVSSYAVSGVNFAQRVGLIYGKDDNQFDPKGNTSYGDNAVMIMRLVEGLVHSNTLDLY